MTMLIEKSSIAPKGQDATEGMAFPVRLVLLHS
jgi:hypothetical protein